MTESVKASKLDAKEDGSEKPESDYQHEAPHEEGEEEEVHEDDAHEARHQFPVFGLKYCTRKWRVRTNVLRSVSVFVSPCGLE